MKRSFWPSFDEFLELAKNGNVIPIFSEFIADVETPISAFNKLCRDDYSFLFESTEKNDVSGRFSFVGSNPRAIIQSRGHEILIQERGIDRYFQTERDPLDEVRRLLA